MQNTQQNLLNSRWAFVQIKSDELSVQHCQVALQIIVSTTWNDSNYRL